LNDISETIPVTCGNKVTERAALAVPKAVTVSPSGIRFDRGGDHIHRAAIARHAGDAPRPARPGLRACVSLRRGLVGREPADWWLAQDKPAGGSSNRHHDTDQELLPNWHP
jgi:hypothetical protein